MKTAESKLSPQATAKTPVAAPQAAASSAKHPATLAQLMRGTLFPASNVIYAAQHKNFPADVPAAKSPSEATNPIASTSGGWEAVENSSMAIIEVADLLSVPGRKCSSGRLAPSNNADWPQLVQGLRDAGLASYQAAQSKSRDKILDAADVLTTACNNCHMKYLSAKLEDRCS